MDHIYISVSNLELSEVFYDKVMSLLGFIKSKAPIGEDPHIHYFNRHYGFSIRPARNPDKKFDSYSPGLHHFCFRVDSIEDVNKVADGLGVFDIKYDKPKYYLEYSPDYYAVFFTDPDGIRLEVTNFRQNRRERYNNWETVKNKCFD
ncbi:VOC family protein [bacterium]|nr:VOC family protein [bacterium]